MKESCEYQYESDDLLMKQSEFVLQFGGNFTKSYNRRCLLDDSDVDGMARSATLREVTTTRC